MAGKPMFFTLRKHKKKSIFAACLALYGGYYASGKFREYLVRRQICNEASKIGQEPISALQKPRSMYVFLNATANDGKAVKLYEKDVAPVLHLAGIDVTLIKTDYEGHAKSLPGYIDPNIDGIVVAGGGGTLMEVVTGLLRLQDTDTLSRIPIGIVPLGKTNSFFRNFKNSAAQDARNIGNATMAIVRGNTKTADVLEIASEGVRSTYALSGLNWGLFQEVKLKIDAKKHWWAGPWKKQMAFVTRTVRNWPRNFLASLNYRDATVNTEGASSGIDSKSSYGKQSEEFRICEEEGVIQSKQTTNPGGSCQSIENANNDEEHSESRNDQNSSNFANELSGEYGDSQVASNMDNRIGDDPKSEQIKTSGINICLEAADEQSKLRVQVWNPDLGRTAFMSDGWKWIEKNYEIIKSGHSHSFACEELELNPGCEDLSWYSIDGEEFEAKHIKIRILREKLKFFY